MKVIYTEQSLESLEESIHFLLNVRKISLEKVNEIRQQLLDKSDSLSYNSQIGQNEEYLDHLGMGHRRLVEGFYKIIYRIDSNCIYITDFFDTRQDPKKMKG